MAQGEIALQQEMWKTVVEGWNTRIHDFAGDNQVHNVLMGMSGWGVTKDEAVKKPSVHDVVPSIFLR